MFNLDQAINEWRRRMAAAGFKCAEALDELESHLRDEIETQLDSGLDEERAFEIAVQKIGKAAALKQEFAKGNPLVPAMNPQFLRNCCIVSAAFILLVNSWTLLEYELSPIQRAVGLSIVTLIACYIGGLPYLKRLLLLGPHNAAARKAIIFICNFVVIWWTILTFGSAVQIIYLPTGILVNVFVWNLYAAAAATILVLWYGRDVEPFESAIWNSLTPTARESLATAGDEAKRFHHDFIGTEHLLLGLLANENEIVPRVLKKFGADRENIRIEIEKIIGSGPMDFDSGNLRYTPRAKRALELAAKQSGAASRTEIGTEQIFIGLMLEGNGVAALVLKKLGVQLDRAREEITKEMRATPDGN